jgi:hypothetical protein
MWAPHVCDAVIFQANAAQRGTRVIGPNWPGPISPGQSNVGSFPADTAKAAADSSSGPAPSPVNSCTSRRT